SSARRMFKPSFACEGRAAKSVRLRYPRKLDPLAFARRLTDGLHDRHILRTLLARRIRLLVIANAACEVIELVAQLYISPRNLGERAQQCPGSSVGEKTAAVGRHDGCTCTIDGARRKNKPRAPALHPRRLVACTTGEQEAHMAKQRKKPPSRKTASPTAYPGSERARDEKRGDAGPQYGGGTWQQADRRGDDRFGQARNDDADPSELAPGEARNDDNDAPNAADPDLTAAEENSEIESGGQREGMGRGEKPRKPKGRQK
ncbi:MAG TPA: hypothetical protein VLM79_03320, partial [Kofleriaceae bacterium]|nr:hypothetical protein [Kofleriaceae bacterium]